MNLVDEIFCLGSECIKVIRPATPQIVKGRVIRPEPETFESVANVQQADPKTLEQLPEGERNKEALVVHLPCEVFTADVSAGREADVLQLRSKRFKVIQVGDWSREGGFYEAVCTRLGQ